MSVASTATPKQRSYFDLFEVPRKLWIEMSALEKKFLELSWKLHPDKFVNASSEEQELSLKNSSELNDAYRVLREPVARVEYLLELEGMRKEGDAEVQETGGQWDAAIDANASDSDRKAIMVRLNELLNRRSYVRNLVTNVQKELL